MFVFTEKKTETLRLFAVFTDFSKVVIPTLSQFCRLCSHALVLLIAGSTLKFFRMASLALPSYNCFGISTSPPSLSDWKSLTSALRRLATTTLDLCQAVLMSCKRHSTPSWTSRPISSSFTRSTLLLTRLSSSTLSRFECSQNLGLFCNTFFTPAGTATSPRMTTSFSGGVR